MKITVFGSNGQLGQTFKDYFERSRYDFTFLTKDDLDISNENEVKDFFKLNKSNIIINCAAYTRVDEAESNEALCYGVNISALEYIAKECYLNNCYLIHFSTDYVFDGFSHAPYSEDDITSPLSVYGKSKLLGEQVIYRSGCRFCILRCSWLFSEYGHNFLKTILRACQEKSALSVVSDQFGSPTFTHDIANAVDKIIHQISLDKIEDGVFHFSGMPYCSWSEFAENISRKAFELNFSSKPISINRINSSEFTTIAPRPKNSMLSSKKILLRYGIKPSDWLSGIDIVIKKLIQQNTNKYTHFN